MKDNHLSYKVTPEGAAKIERLREKYIELDDLIDELVFDALGRPDSEWDVIRRETVLAKTCLEDSRMRAVLAIVRGNNSGPNQDPG